MADKKLAQEVIVTTIGNTDYLTVTIGDEVRRIKITDIADILNLGGSLWRGEATPASTPDTSTKSVYFAKTAGTYTNYGGIVVSEGFVFLQYDGSSWIKATLSGLMLDNAILANDLDANGKNVKNLADATNPGDAIPNGQIQSIGDKGLKLWAEKYGTFADGLKVIEMIKSVYIHNPIAGTHYGIRLLCNNDTTYHYNFMITDDLDNTLWSDNIASYVTDPNGLNNIKLTLSDGAIFEMIIDFSLYQASVILNTPNHSEYVWIDKSRYITNDYNYLINKPQFVESNALPFKLGSNLITIGVGVSRPTITIPLASMEFEIKYSDGTQVFIRLKSKTYEFSNNFKVLAIDLTVAAPANGDENTELVEVSYYDTDLLNPKKYFPVAFYWSAGNSVNSVTFNPYIEQFVDFTNTNKADRILKPYLKELSTPLAQKKYNILLAGSSITWGYGNLDDGFVGEVDKWIKKELSTIVKAEDMTPNTAPSPFTNPKCHSNAKEIAGLNNKFEFDLYGDEIAICQAIKRTTDWAKMQVKADGVVIGTFTNHNNTLGSDTDNFTGDGSSVNFMLSHPYTYNHTITVGGVAKISAIATNTTDTPAGLGVDVLIVRKLDANGKPKHKAWFATAPASGDAIAISYSYGKVIFHERSTVGQIGNDDETNEMNYGDGAVSFDPAHPQSLTSGMEFRAIDERAFFVHKFTSKATRHFEIEIIDGTNPYFIIDFASNLYHNLMNAGIGGWKLHELLNGDLINDYNDFFQYWIPDVIVNESATNDDWYYGDRRISRTLTGLTEAQVKDLWTLELNSVTYQSGTGDYTVVSNTGLITAIDTFQLTSAEIVGSGVVAGDIVRIGNYHGDNKQVAVREIDTVNTTTGVITWLEPLYPEQILNVNDLSDLVGAEIAIRDLSAYQTDYETLIEKLQKIAPQAQILLTQPGLSNYFERQLWGYEIIHRKLSILYDNVNTIEITDWLYDYQKGNIDGLSYENLTADGSTSYNLVKTGHWQGFRVIVNNEDVYGKDCYIESGQGYTVDQSGTGADLNVTGNYDKSHSVTKALKLVFFKNAPASGIIRIEYANQVWSGDYTHVSYIYGYYSYGQAYIAKLKDLLN